MTYIPRVLRTGVVAKPPSIIFEKSWPSGEILGEWKKRNITLLFKKGRKRDLGKYRPVSLTSLPMKIMEQIPTEKIVKHTQDKNMIQDSQHGFTKGRLCLTNLVAICDGGIETINKGKPTNVMTYLNFLKSFDMVPCGILISKLRYTGLKDGLFGK